MPEALRKADEVLQQGVQGITDLINTPAVINLDFADVNTVMKTKESLISVLERDTEMRNVLTPSKRPSTVRCWKLPLMVQHM